VINPGLDAILAFYPQSNTNTLASSVNDQNSGDNLIVKVDHSLSNQQFLTGRYAFARNYQVFPLGSPGGYGTGSRLRLFANVADPCSNTFSQLAFHLSPSKINEVRFGYSRYRTSFSSLNANWNPEANGLNFGTGKLGLPEFDFTGIENLGAIGYSVPRGRTSQTFRSSTTSLGCTASTPSSSAESSATQLSTTSMTIWSAEFISSRRASD